MCDSWTVSDGISTSQSRLSGANMFKAAQTYERIQPSEDDQASQGNVRPHYNRHLSTLRTKLKSQGHGIAPPKKRWLGGLFWRPTCDDLRRFPWRHVGYRSLLRLLPPFAFLGVLALLILMLAAPDLFVAAEEAGCTPDGDFKVISGKSNGPYNQMLYTPWSRSSLWG